MQKQIDLIFDKIFQLLGSETGLNKINQMLMQIDPSKMEPEVYLAYLNYTYAKRNSIKGWDDFYKKIKDDLTIKGYNPDDILPYKIDIKT